MEVEDDGMRRILGPRASGLGPRASGLGPRASGLGLGPRGSLDDPATWLPAIERCTRRCRDPLEREFVIGEVTDALVKAWRAGTCVGSFWAFVKTIARRVTVRQRQRQCLHFERTSEEPVVSAPVERWLPSPQEMAALLRRVRGHRGRSVLRDLWRGRPFPVIAERLGQDVARVHAMVRDLLVHLGIGPELSADFLRGCSSVARRGLRERVAGERQNPEPIPDVRAT